MAQETLLRYIEASAYDSFHCPSYRVLFYGTNVNGNCMACITLTGGEGYCDGSHYFGVTSENKKVCNPRTPWSENSVDGPPFGGGGTAGRPCQWGLNDSPQGGIDITSKVLNGCCLTLPAKLNTSCTPFNVNGGGRPIPLQPHIVPVYHDGVSGGQHCGRSEGEISRALTRAWSTLVANVDLVRYALCVVSQYGGVSYPFGVTSEAEAQVYITDLANAVIDRIESAVPPTIGVYLNPREVRQDTDPSTITIEQRRSGCQTPSYTDGVTQSGTPGEIGVVLAAGTSLSVSTDDEYDWENREVAMRFLAATLLHELLHSYDSAHQLDDWSSEGESTMKCAGIYLTAIIFREAVCWRYMGKPCGLPTRDP